MDASAPVTVSSPEHFKSLLEADLNRVSLLNFWAQWAEPCEQMNEVVSELAKRYQSVLFLNIEAESLPDISESFDVEAVPLFILLRGHTLLSRISGANASALSSAIAQHASATPSKTTSLSKSTAAPAAAPSTFTPVNGSADAAGAIQAAPHPAGQVGAGAMGREETPEELEKRLKDLVSRENVMLFMKGEPEKPRCGFSAKTVALFKEEGVSYGYFDILSDDSVRQGLKKFSDWPTYPQIYVKGELIGGLDILKESIESGEFKELLGH